MRYCISVKWSDVNEIWTYRLIDSFEVYYDKYNKVSKLAIFRDNGFAEIFKLDEGIEFFKVEIEKGVKR